jgi:branched-chain amino acid aminotransferase
VVADPILSLQPLHLSDQVKNLDQASASLPPGAYTTFRTYFGDRALHLSDHINRLAESAALSSKTITLDETLIRCAIREGIALYRQQMLDKANTDADSAVADLRIRLTLGLENVPFDLFLAIEMLPTLPPEAYVYGVPAQTIELQRSLPEAKLTNFIEFSKEARQNLLPGVNEVVMINEAGFLTEGISSNFFAVFGGDIRTAGAGVLSGITRTLVLEQAAEQGIPGPL